MSALTVEPDLMIGWSGSRATTPLRPGPGRTRPARPGQGTGRATGPQSRPGRAVPAPSLRRTPAARPQSCSMAAPAAPQSWQLTDRGIALILVVMATVAFAAVMVIGLTAAQVTSPSYQTYGQSQLALP